GPDECNSTWQAASQLDESDDRDERWEALHGAWQSRRLTDHNDDTGSADERGRLWPRPPGSCGRAAASSSVAARRNLGRTHGSVARYRSDPRENGIQDK